MKVEDWVGTNMVSLEFYDEGKTIPRVTFSEETLSILNRLWENSLVAKLLGKSICYQLFCQRVHLLWKPKGELNILDFGHEYFLRIII